MLEIKLYIADADYEKILDMALPKVAEKLSGNGTLWEKAIKNHKKMFGKFAHRLLQKKGQEGTEQLVAELAEKKRDLLIEKASEFAKKKGIDLRIVGVDVKKC